MGDIGHMAKLGAREAEGPDPTLPMMPAASEPTTEARAPQLLWG